MDPNHWQPLGRGFATLTLLLAMGMVTTACDDGGGNDDEEAPQDSGDTTDDGGTSDDGSSDDGGTSDGGDTAGLDPTGSFNLLLLGMEQEAGAQTEDTDSYQEALFSASGERTSWTVTAGSEAGSYSASPDGQTFYGSDSVLTYAGQDGEDPYWERSFEALSIMGEEGDYTVDFTLAADGQLDFSGSSSAPMLGTLASDGRTLAFNTLDKEIDEPHEDSNGNVTWYSDTVYQNLVVGTRQWNPGDSLQATFNMLGLALVLDNDATDSNGDGGNVTGPGSRALTEGVAYLDASSQTLKMNWYRHRHTLDDDGDAIAAWDEYRIPDYLDAGYRNKSIHMDDKGWIYILEADGPRDHPFAVVAPDASMFVTQTGKPRENNSRSRHRIRVGLPRGGANGNPTCNDSTLDGQYRLASLAIELAVPSSDYQGYEVGHEIGHQVATISSGDLTLEGSDEKYHNASTGFTRGSNAHAYRETETHEEDPPSGGSATLTMESDCTFTAATDGNSVISGIASPDGERVVVTNAETEGTDPATYSWQQIMIGHRVASTD